MGVSDIWEGLKQFFKPTADSLTKDKFDNGLRDMIELYRQYGLPDPVVYYVYNGLFTENVSNFLARHKDNMINYFVPADPDNYVAVIGAEQDGEKYILFRVYDENYRARVGNVMRVSQWPDLGQEVKRVDEIFRELYERYGSK